MGLPHTVLSRVTSVLLIILQKNSLNFVSDTLIELHSLINTFNSVIFHFYLCYGIEIRLRKLDGKIDDTI